MEKTGNYTHINWHISAKKHNIWLETDQVPARGEGSDLYLCKSRCQRGSDATCRQIDQLVYELYGLTEDEIQIIEEMTCPVSRFGAPLRSPF
ncbi:MAG: hypothetical protein HYY45_10350 [Deltaproteobacteria bacterium]|nr:hypothetical protein [Deltaproteobacteria bacterium]